MYSGNDLFEVIHLSVGMWAVKVLRNNLPILRRTCTTAAAEGEAAVAEVDDLDGRDPTKDRRNPHTVETSLRYMQSEAYQITYKGQPVWMSYRRNHKGQIPPRKTRRTCVKHGFIQTGNPCPICRDEYLVLHHENVELLKQFLCPHTGQVCISIHYGILRTSIL